MKTLALIILIASTSFAAPTEILQYSFSPPDFPIDQHGLIFNYYLPAHDGFASNINMTAQHWEGNLEAYDKLSRAQFKQLDMTLISGEILDGVLVYEYNGKAQGLDLHWYVRAVKQGKSVYLITVTTLNKRWEEDSPVLIESANSFILKDVGMALN